jgi:hypothetical protein
MTLNALLTRIHVDSKTSKLITRYKNLGEIYHDWNHLFVTKHLGIETFDEETRKETSKKYKKVLNELKNNKKFNKHPIREKPNFWKILQIFAPTTISSELPKEFISGNYDKQAKWRLATPFSYITLDELTHKALTDTKQIRNQLLRFKEKIRENRKPAIATRIINDIDEIFEQYDATNYREVIQKIKNNKRINSLEKGLLIQRKELADKIITLNKQINPELKLNYAAYKKNKRIHELILTKKSHDYLKYGRLLTGEEFLAKNFLFFDIEIPLFKQKDNTVYFVGANYLKGNDSEINVFAVADYESKTITKDEKKINIVCAKNEDELIKKFVDYTKTKNVSVILAHNSKFDLSKLRDTKQGFKVGADQTDPKMEATTKFFERFRLEDYFVLDTLNWARIAKNYEVNYKLEMIAGFDKIINYDEMATLQKTINSKTEKSKTAFETVSNYQIGDILNPTNNILLTEYFRKTIKHTFNLARMFEVSPEKLLYSPNAILDALEKDFFTKSGIYRDELPPDYKTTQNQKIKEKSSNYFKNHIIKKYITQQQKKGIAKNITKAFLPLSQILNEPICLFFPDVKKLIEYKETLKDDKESLFFIEQYNTALTNWLVEDYGNYLMKENKFNKLTKKHKIDKTKFEKFYQNLKLNINKLPKKHVDDFKDAKLIQKFAKQYLLQPNINSIELDIVYKDKPLDAKTLTEVINARTKIQKKLRSIHGIYHLLPSKKFLDKDHTEKNKLILDDHIESKFKAINEFLEKNKLEVIAQEGNYLYLSGNTDLLQQTNSPLIPVDEIPKAYVADKFYYPKHGFISHLNLKQEPQYNKFEFEVESVSKILKQILAENYEQAKTTFTNNLEALKNNTVPKEKLLYYNKSKERYRCYDKNSERKDKKLFFITDTENVPIDKETKEKKKVFYDKRINKSYFLEKIHNKETKIYIMKPDEIKPDLETYINKYSSGLEKLIKPIKNKKNKEQQLSFNF